MLLVIKAKRIAVGLFQSSLAEDGIPCLYFDISVLNTIVCSALFKLRLCKNLYSKTFKDSEICLRSSSSPFAVGLYRFQFLVAEFMFAL